jgi:hypothetical protein
MLALGNLKVLNGQITIQTFGKNSTSLFEFFVYLSYLVHCFYVLFNVYIYIYKTYLCLNCSQVSCICAMKKVVKARFLCPLIKILSIDLCIFLVNFVVNVWMFQSYWMIGKPLGSITEQMVQVVGLLQFIVYWKLWVSMLCEVA